MTPAASPPSPLGILLRVNALALWRKLASVRERSWLLIVAVAGFLAFYLALAFTLFYRGLDFLSDLQALFLPD